MQSLVYNAEFGPGWIQLEEGLEEGEGQRRVTSEAKGLQWWSVQYKYDPLDQCADYVGDI